MCGHTFSRLTVRNGAIWAMCTCYVKLLRIFCQAFAKDYKRFGSDMFLVARKNVGRVCLQFFSAAPPGEKNAKTTFRPAKQARKKRYKNAETKTLKKKTSGSPKQSPNSPGPGQKRKTLKKRSNNVMIPETLPKQPQTQPEKNVKQTPDK